MSVDSEFEAWRADWQADKTGMDPATLATQLREQSARQTRRQKMGLLAPIAVTVGVGGLLIYRALSAEQPVDIALAIEGWIFIFVTWAVSLWAARGTWRPLAETTSEFLALSIRRCRANMRVAPLAIVLFLVQFFAVLGLVSWYSDTELSNAWPVVIAGGIGLAGLIVWGVLYTNHQKARLRNLLEIQHGLEENGADPGGVDRGE